MDIPITLHMAGSEEVIVAWPEFNTTSMDYRMFLGYKLYYKAVDNQNVSILDDRDACHDSWQMSFQPPAERGAIVTGLQPNTLYAFYVSTLMINSPGAKGGISAVVYAKTEFSQPSLVRDVQFEMDTNAMTIAWMPPEHPRGDVTHYQLQITKLKHALAKHRNYCEKPPQFEDIKFEDPGREEGPHMNSIFGGKIAAANGTCAAVGCCDCASVDMEMRRNGTLKHDPKDVKEVREHAAFENFIFNIVFESK